MIGEFLKIHGYGAQGNLLSKICTYDVCMHACRFIIGKCWTSNPYRYCPFYKGYTMHTYLGMQFDEQIKIVCQNFIGPRTKYYKTASLLFKL
jgi:hypothetical protein